MSDSPASVCGIPPQTGLPPMLNPVLLTAEEVAARSVGATLMSSSALLLHRGSVHRGNSFLGASTASSSLVAPAPQSVPKNSLHTLAQSCAAINVQTHSPAAKGETALGHEVNRICADRMAEASHLNIPTVDSSLEISPMQATAANQRGGSQPGSGDEAEPWPATAVRASAATLFRRASSVRLKENVVHHHREQLARSPQCRSANRTPAAESPSKSPYHGSTHMVALAPMSNLNSTSSASLSPGSETASPQSPGMHPPGSAGRRSAVEAPHHLDEPAWAAAAGH